MINPAEGIELAPIEAKVAVMLRLQIWGIVNILPSFEKLRLLRHLPLTLFRLC